MSHHSLKHTHTQTSTTTHTHNNTHCNRWRHLLIKKENLQTRHLFSSCLRETCHFSPHGVGLVTDTLVTKEQIKNSVKSTLLFIYFSNPLLRIWGFQIWGKIVEGVFNFQGGFQVSEAIFMCILTHISNCLYVDMYIQYTPSIGEFQVSGAIVHDSSYLRTKSSNLNFEFLHRDIWKASHIIYVWALRCTTTRIPCYGCLCTQHASRVMDLDHNCGRNRDVEKE